MGGIYFKSGYDIYPDDFPSEKPFLGALNISSVSNNLWFNPPFRDITKHLVHWLDVVIKTNTTFLIISPVRPNCEKFNFIVNLDITVVIYYKNPVYFQIIHNNYRTPGPCPSQICLIFLNIEGANISVNNNNFGIFTIDPKWKEGLRGLPNTFRSNLDWSGVREVVDKYKIDEQKDFDLCQPQMSFQDRLPEVSSSLDTKPFTPLSPLWSSKLSPLMRIHFPEDYTPVKQNTISSSRAKHLLKTHNGQFLPKGNIHCNLCHANDHATHECFLRIPSVRELGIFSEDDKILYKIFTTIIKTFLQILEIAGETIMVTHDRITAEVDTHRRIFVGLVNKYFRINHPNVKFRWDRPSFSEMRNNLPHHVFLGKPVWIIIQVAFGVRYPWLKIPPTIVIGHRLPIVDKDLWDINEKELLGGYSCISADDWSECLHQIFGLKSSDKLRGIHNLRYLNGYLPKFKYQQENLEDFIRDLNPGDLLWFKNRRLFSTVHPLSRGQKGSGFNLSTMDVSTPSRPTFVAWWPQRAH